MDKHLRNRIGDHIRVNESDCRIYRGAAVWHINRCSAMFSLYQKHTGAVHESVFEPMSYLYILVLAQHKGRAAAKPDPDLIRRAHLLTYSV